MKRKYNTLNEEIYRMKSLFGESRLYGNLVEQEVVNDDTCEWFKPKQNRAIEILEKLIAIAETGEMITFKKEKKKKLQELLLVLKESKKEIEGMDCKKGIEVICNPENRKKIDEGIEVIDEEKDGADAKKFGVKDDLEELLTLLNEIKGKCDDFVNSEEETDNTEVVDNSEENVDNDEKCEERNCDDAIEIDDKLGDGVLDLCKIMGGENKENCQCKFGECKIPIKLSEEMINSTNEIVYFEDDFVEGPHIDYITLCGDPIFTNVSKISCLGIEHGNKIKKMFPNLKTIDSLQVDKEGKILDMIPKDVLINEFYFSTTNDLKIVDDLIKINSQIKMIPTSDLSDHYSSYLKDEYGWTEKEGEDGITVLTNPKNKVQEIPQVNVIGGKEETEEEDDSDTDEKEVQTGEKPKMMVDDEEKDIIYTSPKLNKDFNIGKFVHDKSKDEFKIKSKYPFLLTRTNNLVERTEDAFWKTLSKWYDKPLNSDNTTLDIINDKKFKVKIK